MKAPMYRSFLATLPMTVYVLLLSIASTVMNNELPEHRPICAALLSLMVVTCWVLTVVSSGICFAALRIDMTRWRMEEAARVRVRIFGEMMDNDSAREMLHSRLMGGLLPQAFIAYFAETIATSPLVVYAESLENNNKLK